MTVGLAGLAVVGTGGSVPVLMLGWAVAQLGCNAAMAAMVSCIPDLVPPHQQARVSGIVGMMTSVAMILGTFLADAFDTSLALAFLVPAVIGLASVLYLSVDVALAAAVLPNPEESAKDMGVLNIGNALPQSLVPIAAPAILAIGGGGN
ncbi:MFS transporter [Streptomyces sp. NPDC053253]|uniref:MFS transporter n=1 Tax=Streptomyces sp. NPDC053253 TaxID=3365699 RepID=UPI0037D428E2